MDSCLVVVLGTKLRTLTDRHGRGVIKEIPPGSYEVKVGRRGVEPIIRLMRFEPALAETLRQNMHPPAKYVSERQP
jgi:hypothetical protein